METIGAPDHCKTVLERILAKTLDSLDPEQLTIRALTSLAPSDSPPTIIALGKAASSMAAACVSWLENAGLSPADGLIVSDHPSAASHPALQSILGDHPIPGSRSLAAANALGELINRIPSDSPVEIFLSGGTTALIAAPNGGSSQEDLSKAFGELHREGLSIQEMNTKRSRMVRWGGGRLAAALDGRECRVWYISDVIGNDLATIGSGPLVTDGASPSIPHLLVADRHTVLEKIADAASSEGLRAKVHTAPLDGDASSTPRQIFGQVKSAQPIGQLSVEVWTGETTVKLPKYHGTGGRCQQLTLAAAQLLADYPPGSLGPLAVLAAGTDGRDGPTDAAGAIANRDTWRAIEAAGVDPNEALGRCDSHPALEAAEALIRTGSTGNNLGDIVLVLNGS